MKKVLILSVIAMLALGVFALAAGSASAGPTCQVATLTVTSNIVVVQGFEATATSYDATFCGATGNPLTGQYQAASLESGVLLASLTVKSNMNNIGVSVTPTFPTNPSGLTASLLEYYNNGNVWSNGSTMDLLNSSSPYAGELDVVLTSSIAAWTQGGKNVLTIQFVVTPKTSEF